MKITSSVNCFTTQSKEETRRIEKLSEDIAGELLSL